MEFWLWLVIGVLVCILLGLVCKLISLRKAAREMETGLAERLRTETNTLIDLSSRDRYMRALAAALNEQLRLLRGERRRFQLGDLELKEAVTNISHDLRTPLTAICGYLDLLEREEKSEAVTRYLERITDRTAVLTRLTEELFGYSMAVSGGAMRTAPPERVVLNHVLEESIAAYYAVLHEKGITPEISLPDTPVERMLDRHALARIFGNILSNAVKYSGGDLSVALSADGKIVFANTAANLDPLLAGRLFDRFFTVETGRNSTGLGLSIARHLTEQLGGTITADYREKRLYITLEFAA